MSKVEQLFPKRSPAKAGTHSADGTSVDYPLIESLRSLASRLLLERLDRMFDGADDMLFEMAGRAASNAEQRVFFDTMRIVRLNRPQILKEFRKQIDAGFISDDSRTAEPAAPEPLQSDQLTLQDTSSLERSIALSNMATKAEGRFKDELFELGNRFRWLADARRVPLNPDALQPQKICDAFVNSTTELEVEFATELVIYKLFDRCVIGELGELYARVLELARQLSQAMPSSYRPGMQIPPGAVSMAGYPGSGGVAGDGALPGIAGGGYAPVAPVGAPVMMGVPQYTLDPQTLASLQQIAAAGTVAMASYSDDRLARDLTMAAQGIAVPGWGMQQASAYVQRAGLVGQMFNSILADPNMPTAIKPQFDQLRLSVVKSALKDVSFFADPNHPVRGLINEVAEMAASARTAGEDALKRITELVGQIQKQFDVAAESVQQIGEDEAPVVPEALAESFIEQQTAETDRRRRAIIDKVKKIVGDELKLRLLGRRVPKSVMPLLEAGWSPMMSMRLLRQGISSAAWEGGLELLDRIVDLVDPSQTPRTAEAIEEERHRREALQAELRRELTSVNLAPPRVDRLLLGLGGGFEQLDDRRATEAREALAREIAARAKLNVSSAEVAPPTAVASVADGAEDLLAATRSLTPVERSDAFEIEVEVLGPVSAPELPAAPLTPPAAPVPAVEDADEFPITMRLSAILNDESRPSEAPAAPNDSNTTRLASEASLASATGRAPSAPAAELPAEPESQSESIEDLIDRLIVPGSWFRVFDRELDDSRWLRVVTRYTESNRVSFSDFNGHQHWFIDTRELVADLLDGRAGPIDFTPAAKRILDQLRERFKPSIRF